MPSSRFCLYLTTFMKKKTITVSVISELTTDQRVIRICTTLVEMGFDVHVIARRFSDSLPLDEYPFTAERLRCYSRKGFMQFAEFNTRLFFRLLFRRTDYLLANDLDALVPNYIVSRLRRKKIFYDTHEYYTGVPALSDAPFKRRVWKFFEDWILPRLPVVYTVTDSVRDKYREEYGIEMPVIRNLPVTTKVVARTTPCNWKDKRILLMQGMGIHPGRGGMELLETMRHLPSPYHLVFIGWGTQWDDIARKRTEWNLEDRVEMIPKLAPARLKEYTPLAHLGFTLDQSQFDNYRFALPNRMLDYIHAGVPVAATPVPEVKNIIEQYHCGFCFNSQSPKDMAAEIEALMNDSQRYQSYKANTVTAARELCWEKEKSKLESLYEPFL